MKNTNPLLEKFAGFDACVPFDQIKIEHYKPALEESIKIAKTNIDAIKNNPAAPSFENVIVALETCAERMGLVGLVFHNLET